jgi:hypothetical protein
MSAHRCASVLALLLALSPVATLAATPRLIAVLPFGVTGPQSTTSADTLTEAVRQATGDALSPLGYTVLTNDNTLQILADNGIDAAKACEGSCSLEVAREFKARLFITGLISSAETENLVGFVRLFDGLSGRQLKSIQVEGKTMRDLRVSFQNQSAAFFASAIEALKDSGIVSATKEVTLDVHSEVPGQVFKVATQNATGSTPCPQDVMDIQPCRLNLFPGEFRLNVSGAETFTSTLTLTAPGGDVVIRRGRWPAIKKWALAGVIVGGVAVPLGVILAATVTNQGAPIACPVAIPGQSNCGYQQIANPVPGIAVLVPGALLLAAGIVGLVVPQNEVEATVRPLRP